MLQAFKYNYLLYGEAEITLTSFAKAQLKGPAHRFYIYIYIYIYIFKNLPNTFIWMKKYEENLLC